MIQAITIVSGLPRSGTSMMMQLLRAGGFALLCDDARAPDEDNPRGYLEYAPVKRLERDASWLAKARGKAVKIVAPLLVHLPPEHAYRVIWMRRDLDEVLASQRRMLARRRTAADAASEERLRESFSAQMDDALRRLERAAVPTLTVEYRAVVDAPEAWVPRIAAFVGGLPHPQRAVAAVDRRLYRERSKRRSSVR